MVTAGAEATAVVEIAETEKGCERIHVGEKEITSAALLTDIFHKLIQITQQSWGADTQPDLHHLLSRPTINK